MSDDKLKIAVNRPFQAGSDKHVMVKHRVLEHLSVFMDVNSRPHDTTQKLISLCHYDNYLYKNCLAPDTEDFSRNFPFLRRRRAYRPPRRKKGK